MTLPRYIYELPYSARQDVCVILDITGAWKDLAAAVFTMCDVKRFGLAALHPTGSPADRFLIEWGHRNATISDLYCRLAAFDLDECLAILHDYVPEETRNDVELANSEDTPSGSTENDAGPAFTSELPLPSYDFKQPVDDSSNQYRPTIPDASSQNGNNISLVSCSDNVSYDGPNILSDQSDLPHIQHHKLLNYQPAQYVLPSTGLHVNLDVSGSAISNTHHFKYDDIKKATNSFSPSNLIGQGGFGLVYKGILKNTNFAFKQLKTTHNNLNTQVGMRQHIVEMEALLRFRHENIIQLCGFSIDGEKLCLVLQFMPNGSLHDRLACKDKTSPLTWRQRHNILRGSARGIQYLHTVMDKPLIHGDIKSANILLDRSFEAKVSDFGLAKQATSSSTGGAKLTHVTCCHQPMFGSGAYLPDEFLTASCYRYSVKTDSFSFGVVIFEACTGRNAWDSQKQLYLKDDMKGLCQEFGIERLLYLRDMNASTWPSQKWLQLLKLAMDLTNDTQKQRPDMEAVLQRLETMETCLFPSPGADAADCSATSSRKTPVQLQREFDLLRVQQNERKQRMDQTYRQVEDICQAERNHFRSKHMARTEPLCRLDGAVLPPSGRGLEDSRHTISTIPEKHMNTSHLPDQLSTFQPQATTGGGVLDIYCTQTGTFDNQTDTAIIRMKKTKIQPGCLQFDDDDE